MTDVKYEFHVSEKRKIKKVILDFSKKDFFHLAGFQQYLDTNNIIKIFSVKDTPFLHSVIDADYIIESSVSKRNKTVYIFMKERREEQGVYCIVSFFVKKQLVYGGQKLYWMLKKIIQKQAIILYQHPNYNEENVGNNEGKK